MIGASGVPLLHPHIPASVEPKDSAVEFAAHYLEVLLLPNSGRNYENIIQCLNTILNICRNN